MIAGRCVGLWDGMSRKKEGDEGVKMGKEVGCPPLFTYDKFSKVEWYQEVNRHLAAMSGIKPGDRVLDIGCGTGSSTASILQQMNDQGEVIAIDRNKGYLDIAKEKLSKCPNVSFVEADVAGVGDVIQGPIDAGLIFNTIHLIRDHRKLFSGIASVLKPGGILAFNTTYFAENDSELRRFQSGFWSGLCAGLCKEARI